MPEMQQNPHCQCFVGFEIGIGRIDEYDRFKKVLNAGRHPTFIGRDLVRKKADNGGCLFFRYQGEDIAVALVNPKLSTLMVLNVVPKHRGHGLGRALVAFLSCNFVRAIEDKVTFFQSCGYTSIGKMKTGRKFGTQIMVRSNLPTLAGRMRKIYG